MFLIELSNLLTGRCDILSRIPYSSPLYFCVFAGGIDVWGGELFRDSGQISGPNKSPYETTWNKDGVLCVPSAVHFRENKQTA